ncbi:WXG100 family type VII secretion target [Nocardia sp. XZ_19_385]|uniref:WXG100 family type VII secretion target n=1 Tax=Nocardia sp. XZ_19_385 TaxID=2769488 RepID=UPI00188E67D4|nr:WXG100 family type VII secretion target [Nocardia sp. XZ_19_385]
MSTESDAPGTDFAMVPSEVTDAGVYIQQVADSLITGLSSLDRDVSSVLDNWSGAAADAFGDGWTATKKGAADVLDALNAMGGLLGVASKTITDQDISNSINLSSLDLPELNM